MATLQSLFLEHALPERYVPLLGQPDGVVRTKLAELAGDEGLVVLSINHPLSGLPIRSSMQFHSYVELPDSTRAISIALGTAELLIDGIAPTAFIEAVAACWDALKAELPSRLDGLRPCKAVHPLKKPVATAAPALKPMLKEAFAFDGGTLEQHASIHGGNVLRWDLTFERR